jgi:hypothetical protein
VTGKRPVLRGFRIPIQLIYDTFLSAEPVGLRSSWESGFQALYHAGSYSLDFRVEPGPGTRLTIVGQIANRATPGAAMAGILVCLKAGRTLVAQTHTNQFGEFQMEYEERKGIRLRVELGNPDRESVEPENPRHIEAPLRRLASKSGERPVT